jgi:hypothetical protein
MPDAKLFIVMYLMDGHYRATRHADGCGILRRAVKASEGEVRPGRGERPEIWDDNLYPGRHGPEPRDHACVAKAAEDADLQRRLT